MKIWFAEKQNGEIIELTEREALLHFEDNNVSRRMRLRFLGTSNGDHYRDSKKKMNQFIIEKAHEEVDNFSSLDPEEKNAAYADIRVKYKKELKEIQQAGYNAELEEAKANGVQRPDKSLHIVTSNGNGGQASSRDRQIILKELGGRL